MPWRRHDAIVWDRRGIQRQPGSQEGLNTKAQRLVLPIAAHIDHGFHRILNPDSTGT